MSQSQSGQRKPNNNSRGVNPNNRAPIPSYPQPFPTYNQSYPVFPYSDYNVPYYTPQQFNHQMTHVSMNNQYVYPKTYQNTTPSTQTNISTSSTNKKTNWKVNAREFVPVSAANVSIKATSSDETKKNLESLRNNKSPQNQDTQQLNKDQAETIDPEIEKREKEKRVKEEIEEKERREKEEKLKQEKEEKEKQEKEQREQEEKERKEKEEREERERKEKEEEEEEEEKKKKEEEEKLEKDRLLEEEEINRNEREDEEEYQEEQPNNQSLDQPNEPSSPPQEKTRNSKKMYERDFLLKFRDVCKDCPETLPQLEAIIGFEDNSRGVLGQPPRTNSRRTPQGQKSQPGSRAKGQSNSRGSMGNKKGPTLPQNENRWIRPSLKNQDDSTEKLTRTVTSLLNKITVEKFDVISEQILEVGIDSAEILDLIIGLSFQKAILEPHFANLYAQLCHKLSVKCPSFPDPSSPEKKLTFRRVLLNRCQDEFEKKSDKEKEEILEAKTEEEKEELRFKQRRKMIGNIKFIAELFKIQLLNTNVVHQSILPRLLKDKPQPDEIEALCKFMKTAGKSIEENDKNKKIDQYFRQIEVLSKDTSYESRIRFMLQDIIELRQNKWVPRREEKTAKKIKEIHQEAEEEENNKANYGDSRTGYRRNDNPKGRNISTSAPSPTHNGRGPISSKPPVSYSSAVANNNNKNLANSNSLNLRPNSPWHSNKDQSDSKSTSVKQQSSSPSTQSSVRFDTSTPPTPLTLDSWEEEIFSIFEELYVNHEVPNTVKEIISSLKKVKEQPQQDQNSYTEVVVLHGCIKAFDYSKATSLLGEVIQELKKENALSQTDIEAGIIKIRENLEDLKLDVPSAPDLFNQLLVILFSERVLKFDFFEKLFPPNLNEGRSVLTKLFSIFANEKRNPSVLFETPFISNYFNNYESLLSALNNKNNVVLLFGSISWEKIFPKETKEGKILQWFESKEGISLGDGPSIEKFIQILLISATRDTIKLSKSAWNTKLTEAQLKSENETFETHSKLITNILSDEDFQNDALNSLLTFCSQNPSEKGLMERLFPYFLKFITRDTMVQWADLLKKDQLSQKVKLVVESL